MKVEKRLVSKQHTIGSLMEVIGVWLAASWVSNRVYVEKCFRRKIIMGVTIALWLSELALGMYVYMMLCLGG
jgi:uncharacterized membrane protein YozB (DUF420 family)